MCNLSELVWEEGMEAGREESRAALEEARNALDDNIRKIMQKLGMTAEQAMDLLEIPEDNRAGILRRI